MNADKDLQELTAETPVSIKDDIPQLPVKNLVASSHDSISTSLVDDIRNWSTEFHITQAAVTSLVGVLNSHLNLNLPNDARTIMKTPRNVRIVEMTENGRYWHLGLQNCLQKALEHLDRPLSISLNINIDDLPVHKSSI
ncbi:uncharacterized protein LOC129719563 [Wyeomyia smithii]|uniref:uncharacterized protein LOC129719563 n=1 Tax=Wyeomyia smithii TaxID=174621 RepID=UPI002467FED8|nr:uncharacterized protein LOC129719563 [Wyeomyia smithii]